MAAMICLDTHVVAWLYAGELDRFGAGVRARLETERLVISPMVQLELTYLHEIERLRVGGAVVVGDLAERVGLETSSTSLAAVIAVAESLAWTRDPFDRLIVADAMAAAAPLVTKDRLIHARYDGAVWD